MTETTLPRDLHRDTLAVRAAVDKSQYGENSEALYLTSSFVQPNAETAARRFAGEEEGYTYSRFTNPTVTSMEQRLAALEGTEACIGTSSGMSAIMLLCMGLLKAGDHVICSQSVFGSTIRLFAGEFAKFGQRNQELRDSGVAADSRWFTVFGAMTFFVGLGGLINWMVVTMLVELMRQLLGQMIQF